MDELHSNNKFKTLKIFFTIIGIFLLLFGFIGFMTCAATSTSSVNVSKYYKPYPLNDKNGLVVDSNGNIYIGDTQTGSIQVYDMSGNFQYGFNFPTGGSGWFTFGIEQDKIHVLTTRTQSHFIFNNGELISSEKGIDYNQSEKLQKQYHMTTDNSYELNNRIYTISTTNTIDVKDKATGQIQQIHLNVPIYPFPIYVFWIIGVMGMALLYIVQHKFFSEILKAKKKK